MKHWNQKNKWSLDNVKIGNYNSVKEFAVTMIVWTYGRFTYIIPLSPLWFVNQIPIHQQLDLFICLSVTSDGHIACGFLYVLHSKTIVYNWKIVWNWSFKLPLSNSVLLSVWCKVFSVNSATPMAFPPLFFKICLNNKWSFDHSFIRPSVSIGFICCSFTKIIYLYILLRQIDSCKRWTFSHRWSI